MERIEALINKLKEQFDQRLSPVQLQMTVQLLQNELAQHQANGVKTLGTSKVAVVLPSVSSGYEQFAPRPIDIIDEQPEVNEVKETILVDEGSVSVVQKNGQLDMVFDPMTEIPTLSHQPREVNDANALAESLNDRLKQGKTEVPRVFTPLAWCWANSF